MELKEIIKEEIGSEFLVRYDRGEIDKDRLIISKEKRIVWKSGKELELDERFLNAEFKKIDTKEYTFNEILQKIKEENRTYIKVRVEHELMDYIINETNGCLTNTETKDSLLTREIKNKLLKEQYLPLYNIIYLLGYYLSDINICKIIEEGRWYIYE